MVICMCVCFLDHKIGRKWYSLGLGNGTMCMTKNGNDRIIELFWRKRKKQWSIKQSRSARTALLSNLIHAVWE